MTTIIIDLPVPPSVNSIWRQGKQRVYINPKYTAWKREADGAIMAAGGVARLGKIEERCHILIQINEKMVRPNRDIDNFNKVPVDYCKRLGLIKDDNLKICRRVTAEIDETGENTPLGCRVTLQSV